jgi:hypothetical protein
LKALTILVAWLFVKQKMMGVAVNADALAAVVRVARTPFSGQLPLWRAGEARALVASARETRVEKNFMLIVEKRVAKIKWILDKTSG